MRKSQVLAGRGLLAFMLLVPQIVFAQQASDEINKLRFELLQKELESIKSGQKAILDELQEMKKLLSSPRGEARGDDRSPVRDINITLTIAEAFSKGEKQAPL